MARKAPAAQSLLDDESSQPAPERKRHAVRSPDRGAVTPTVVDAGDNAADAARRVSPQAPERETAATSAEAVTAESTALAHVEPAPVVSMFERLARDPSVDPDKLERLIGMQERILAHQAKAEFDAAFSELQGELPEIGEQGEIVVDGRVRSRYAKNEDIQREIKPILQKHGFSIRFRNEFVAENGKQLLRVIGILSHRSGHSEQDEFVAAADTSGSKNAIQALGSTRSYGQRYTTIALLNIASRDPRDRDDDGQTSEQYKQPEAPEGYEDWIVAMSEAANGGWTKLSEAFGKAAKPFRDHALKADKVRWELIKQRAQKGKAL